MSDTQIITDENEHTSYDQQAVRPRHRLSMACQSLGSQPDRQDRPHGAFDGRQGQRLIAADSRLLWANKKADQDSYC
jgi:hypothetical protein